jgi:hypothetical protein
LHRHRGPGTWKTRYHDDGLAPSVSPG